MSTHAAARRSRRDFLHGLTMAGMATLLGLRAKPAAAEPPPVLLFHLPTPQSRNTPRDRGRRVPPRAGRVLSFRRPPHCPQPT